MNIGISESSLVRSFAQPAALMPFQEPPAITNEVVHFPGGIIDLGRRELRYENGQTLEIFGRELALLKYLVSHAGRIISREELLLQVWEMKPQFIVTRTIDMHVAKLRDKLRDDPHHPQVLLTIRGEGYMFVAPSAQSRDPVEPAECAESARTVCLNS